MKPLALLLLLAAGSPARAAVRSKADVSAPEKVRAESSSVLVESKEAPAAGPTEKDRPLRRLAPKK